MLSSRTNKYLANPVLGLIPFLVYLIFHHAAAFGEPQAIALGTAVGLGLNLWTRLRFGTRAFSLTYYVVGIAFLFTFALWFFDSHIVNKNIYVIICEVVIICLFIIIRLNKRRILVLFYRKKAAIYRIYFNEYIRSTFVTQYLLTGHLFAALLYQSLVPETYADANVSFVLYTIVPITIVVVLMLFEIVKIQILSAKLKKEEWLPIITEEGAVIGKIAKTEAVHLTNTHLHPVVRVALVSDGKLFLQERHRKCIIDAGKTDYPFEKYVLFNNDIDKAVKNCIKRIVGYELEGEPKFVLKYTYENEKTKRLILLYYLYVKDAESIARTPKMHGKFWTIKQIEEGFADNIFGENFELEFEYLKNTVEELNPDKIPYLLSDAI